ncbi:unnamed protein product [Cyprideis torosa]|uniref:Elongation of very long chain fatty acids protein n=1 Tax=Cyprideis torosa TaxID=163714 RepID=A0A7R8W4I9_9CRUS|nr:unnamed protein product [Cyprideis torosa]CAG0883216.1 unnamed protein product [Cyprideis torosa]
MEWMNFRGGSTVLGARGGSRFGGPPVAAVLHGGGGGAMHKHTDRSISLPSHVIPKSARRKSSLRAAQSTKAFLWRLEDCEFDSQSRTGRPEHVEIISKTSLRASIMASYDGLQWDPKVGFVTDEEMRHVNFMRYNQTHRTEGCYNLFLFEVEKSFGNYGEYLMLLFRRYWWLGFPITALYLVLIFGGQRLMKNRQPYDLQRSLIVWNWLLAAMSLFTASKGIAFIANEIYFQRWTGILCFVPVHIPSCMSATLHGLIFSISKVIELGDTAFIVLRKKPLIFLHWYHHVTVLLYTWYYAGKGPSVGIFFAINNSIVHTLMYSYYALRAMNVRVPRWASMTLTLTQINQMIVGIYLNYCAYNLKRTKYPNCMVSNTDFAVTVAMYSSYCILFMWFFYRAYLGGKGGKRRGFQNMNMRNLMGHSEHEKIS